MFDPNTPQKLQAIFKPFKKIVLIGSATGGHIVPLINLTKLLPDISYHALVGIGSLEEELMSKNHIPHTKLSMRRVGDG